jgi:hypothetical protein
MPPPTAGVPTSAPPAPLPWEQAGYPPLEGLYETAKLFIVEPSAAFSRMSTTGDLGRPLIYAVIFGWLGIIAGQVYNLAWRGMMLNLLPMFGNASQFQLPWVFNLGMMIIGPILVLIGIFIAAVIFHLFLMLVGGANSGFGATVRVICYSGTVQILQVVPLCGGFIAAIWAIVLYILGFAKAHRTTTGKAALAVLLPMVLCCACVTVIAIAFGAAIMAAIAHFR